MSISLFPGMMGSQFQLVLTPSGKPTSDHKSVVVFFRTKAISKHKCMLQLTGDLRKWTMYGKYWCQVPYLKISNYLLWEYEYNGIYVLDNIRGDISFYLCNFFLELPINCVASCTNIYSIIIFLNLLTFE